MALRKNRLLFGPHRWLVRWLALASLGFASMVTAAGTDPRRSVAELFTSEGCSSCPPADALAGRLSADPSVLVLSFHVNYWDDLGWKDTFSSKESTDRQYVYARALGQRSVFTPQIIVNGKHSLVGSQEADVRQALTAAGNATLPVQANLSKEADGSFKLVLAGPALAADVWEVRYVRHAVTRIRAGENGGRTLETFNNVTQLRRIGPYQPGESTLQALQQPDDGLAILVQKPAAGEVLGIATYSPTT